MFNFLKRYKDEVIETNNASHEDTRNEMMKWMKSIDEACWDTKRRLEAIEAFCQAMFPSDNDSIQQRKRENLAKIYARHLIEKEGFFHFFPCFIWAGYAVKSFLVKV